MKRDHIDFDERTVPLGYVITFRCYGIWLHCDERGSVDRRFYDRIGGPKIRPDADAKDRKARLMKHEVFLLPPREREVVARAIRQVCVARGYGVHGLNVRTNHVHIVAAGSGRPERMMNSFKAYSTRALTCRQTY